jgi:hypothetical protein
MGWFVSICFHPGDPSEMSSILADHSALVYEPKIRGEGLRGLSLFVLLCTCDGAQINFGDLTPYLTHVFVLPASS